MEGGSRPFLKKLGELRQVRDQLHGLLADIAGASGQAKLAPIGKGVKFLEKKDLIHYPGPLLADWLAVAREHDGHSVQGVYELVFADWWLARLTAITTPDAAQFRELLKELDDWKTRCTFKDADKGATVHLFAVMALLSVRDMAGAGKYVDAALGCHPRDPKIVAGLHGMRAAIQGGLGSGSGFVVDHRHVQHALVSRVRADVDRQPACAAKAADSDWRQFQLTNHVDRQQQVLLVLVIEQRDKPVLEVKPARRFVDGVNLNRSNADVPRNVNDPAQGVGTREGGPRFTPLRRRSIIVVFNGIAEPASSGG